MRREMTLSRALVGARRARYVLAGALATLYLIAAGTQPAKADFTHKYLGQITLASGTSPQPSGVDSEGNIIVFLDDQEVIAKYDTDGNPVDFSALGTNVIDGEGGLNCPDVPSDCDRVPAGKLGPFLEENYLVVVDQSGGPADGYIYVRNHDITRRTGEVAVFAPSGKFLGIVDETQAQPGVGARAPAHFMSIAPNGTLYLGRNWAAAGGNTLPGVGQVGGVLHQVDQYAPIDGNPAHDLFFGQLRLALYGAPEIDYGPRNVIGAGPNGIFLLGPGAAPTLGDWRWYSVAEAQKPGADFSYAIDYLPFPSDNFNPAYPNGAVNPNNANIHRFSSSGMAIWDQTAHKKVGPTIGTGGEIGNAARTIAFDNSGGLDNGRFYVRGSANSLSVFSGPVVIPNIDVNEPDVGHKSATVNVEIGTAGGPEVTACEIEYGLTDTYGTTKPCAPSPPYSDETPISVELSGLFTEASYHYRIKATNENGFNLTDDNVVRTAAVLGVKTGAVTDLHATSAAFNGSLDPDGMNTMYRFQYGLDTKYDLETPEESVASGSGEIALDPTAVEELQPGRTYHYRLVAENELGTTYGPDRTFTAPARPVISSLRPSDVAATSATLHARINNFDLASEYHFEYGQTAVYGQSTPVQQLGPDPTFQEVGALIDDLQPGITYNFRLVATNSYGTSQSANGTFDFSPPSCPNSHVRQQVGANYLPDCRAYELVSPGRAGSIQLFPGDFANLVLDAEDSYYNDPDRAPRFQNGGYASTPARFGFFGGLGALSGTNAPNIGVDHYLATRTERGWQSHFAGLKGDETGYSFRGQCSLSFDKCIDYRGVYEGGYQRRPFPYVWDSTGKFLGRWPTNYAVVPEADHLTGDEKPSGDFSHFVFSSLDLPFLPGALDSAPGSVYDNEVGPGTLKIASKLPGGADIPQDAGGADEFINIPAISPDGSHILMSTIAPGGHVNLFMRVDDAITYEISAGKGVELTGMSADGSTVAFMSDSALTPADTDNSRDIYLWREATDEVTVISQGNGHGNSDSCNANWTQDCDVVLVTPERPDIDDVISVEGDIYFYSPEQLDAENPGVFNQRNLYHLRDGEVQYVTTFDPGTQVDRMQISADGQHAAFLTKAKLTAYDSNYVDNFGVERVAREMYAFDATSGEVQCASCNPAGASPSVLRADPPGNHTGATSADVMASKNGPFMSEDGRVAFATADAIVPRDTNGKIDVYEFVGGRPQLITSGTGARDLLSTLSVSYPGQNTGLEAMSRDGIDIYFSTFETLVPQDENGAFIKFYDARTGGGFPVQGELLPCEAADECHGETSAPAQSPAVGTATPYSVPGNVAQTKKKKRHKRGRAHKKKRQRGSARSHGRGGPRNG